jgi:hydroxyacylglutathione hydrolase
MRYARLGVGEVEGAAISFCSAPLGAERTSTIAREVATSPLPAADGEDAFVAALLGSLGSFPQYSAAR